MSLSLRGTGKPLSIKNVLEMDRVWIEPITSDIDLAAELRGWYIMYDKRLAQNDFGNRFYLNTYGVNMKQIYCGKYI